MEQSEEREEEFNNVSEEMFNSTWEGDDDDKTLQFISVLLIKRSLQTSVN